MVSLIKLEIDSFQIRRSRPSPDHGNQFAAIHLEQRLVHRRTGSVHGIPVHHYLDNGVLGDYDHGFEAEAQLERMLRI